MRSLLILTLLLALVLPAVGADRVTLYPQDSSCKKVAVNLQGTANADITIDGTAGGISVMAANSMRCGAVIKNSGSADMRCAPTTVTVTSTVGFLIAAGDKQTLGLEAAQAWKCIRTGSSTTASVLEAIP